MAGDHRDDAQDPAGHLAVAPKLIGQAAIGIAGEAELHDAASGRERERHGVDIAGGAGPIFAAAAAGKPPRLHIGPRDPLVVTTGCVRVNPVVRIARRIRRGQAPAAGLRFLRLGCGVTCLAPKSGQACADALDLPRDKQDENPASIMMRTQFWGPVERA